MWFTVYRAAEDPLFIICSVFPAISIKVLTYIIFKLQVDNAFDKEETIL